MLSLDQNINVFAEFIIVWLKRSAMPLFSGLYGVENIFIILILLQNFNILELLYSLALSLLKNLIFFQNDCLSILGIVK